MLDLVIDASNLRKGGGVTHLKEVLSVVDFDKYAIAKVVVWVPVETARRIGKIDRVEFRHHPLIERAGVAGLFFRKWVLGRKIDKETDLLWAPGGHCACRFRPYVTMVRNFLPFSAHERNRFKYSMAWLRLFYLQRAQARSFRNADGLIHLSGESSRVINDQLDLSAVEQRVIHHGLSSKFLREPRPQRGIDEFTERNPARMLYVSSIYNYKHQDKLVEACDRLRMQGIPLVLDLVGAQYPPAMRRLTALLKKCESGGNWVRFHNEVSYEEIQRFYHGADLFAFMSSCETFGMALLEAMASGLPILCSNRSALPEIQGGTCPEVDPEDVDAVAAGLERMIRDQALRERCAQAAYERAQSFTWEKCADATFKFLAECAKR